jgi:hypothetical protein
MNGQELLAMLLQLQSDGVDLSQYTVACGYNSVDPSIPYDCGIEERVWPSDVRIDLITDELLIR